MHLLSSDKIKPEDEMTIDVFEGRKEDD